LHHIGLEADKFSHTVNQSASDEHGIACDEFHAWHCIVIADEKAWKYGNNWQGSSKGHLDPPCNLIQEKTSGKRQVTIAIDIFAT
jgi:hypothetical protein